MKGKGMSAIVSPKLYVAHSAGGGHLTEDAWFGAIYEHHAVMAVADGAPVRLRPIASLSALTAKYAVHYGAEVTPSGVAARLVRDTVAKYAPDVPFVPLPEIVVKANAQLASDLEAIYGALSAEAILKAEPQLTILAEEPRALRLTLPACTYTAVRVDLACQQLEVAHGADSALLLLMDDGTMQQITPDQMAQHDDVYEEARRSMPDELAHHPFFRALGFSRAVELDRMNGLYHNYVAPDGTLDPTVGVSVVNGLPQMRDYMFTAVRPLVGVQAVIVASDGAFWPLDSNAAMTPAEQLNHMGRLILEYGSADYLKALRAEERRLALSHDDASIVMLWLG